MVVKFPKLYTVLFNFTGNRIVIMFVIIFGIKQGYGLASMGTGPCPVMKNLAIVIWQNFQGLWYEYASYGDATTSTLYKCMKYTFTTTENHVSAVREFVSKWSDGISSTGYKIVYDGFFDFIMETDSGTQEKIWVLDTDYNNFAIFWTCYEYGAFEEYFHLESSWILTRTSTEYASVDVEIKIDEALKKHSMERISYDPVTRDECPNFPT